MSYIPCISKYTVHGQNKYSNTVLLVKGMSVTPSPPLNYILALQLHTGFKSEREGTAAKEDTL